MKLLPVLLLALFSAAVVPTAFAAGNGGTLTVAPAYQEVTLTKPGEVRDIPISYTNSGNKPLTLQMFPINFAHADAYGTISFLGQTGSYAYGLASYLTLESDKLLLEPHESAIFHVSVKNRDDLSPGGHYAAVIGKVISSNETEGAVVNPSVSSLIFLRKTGGERFNLSLREVNWGSAIMFSYPHSALLQFQNEGNIHVFPFGVMEVRDSFGRLLKRGELNVSSFMVLPESRRYIPVDLKPIAPSFPISLNTITVSGTDSLKKTPFHSETLEVYINPWVLGGIVLVIALIIWVFRRRRGKSTKREQKEARKKK